MASTVPELLARELASILGEQVAADPDPVQDSVWFKIGAPRSAPQEPEVGADDQRPSYRRMLFVPSALMRAFKAEIDSAGSHAAKREAARKCARSLMDEPLKKPPA